MMKGLVAVFALSACIIGFAQMPQGDVQSAEYIIEKEKDVKLPVANRFFSPSAITGPRNEKVDVDLSVDEPDFSVPRFQPALAVTKLERNPLARAYKHHIRLGFGSYLSPLVDYTFMTDRQQPASIGARIFHESHINGPVNNQESGESETRLLVWNQLNGERVSAHTRVGYTHQGYYPYGLFNAIPGIDADALGYGRYSLSNISLGTQITARNSGENFNLAFSPNWTYTRMNDRESGDELGREHLLNGVLSIHQAFDNGMGLAIKLDATYSGYSSAELERNRGWYSIQPELAFGLGQLKFQAGVKSGVYTDRTEELQFFIFPAVNASYTMVSGIQFYAVVDGDLKKNSFQQITGQNRVLNDSLDLQTTIEKFRFTAGSKGFVAKGLSYELFFRSKSIDDQVYFRNHPNAPWLFDLVYDQGTMTQLTFSAALTYQTDKLDIIGNARWHGYTTGDGQVPLHVPTFESTLQAFFSPVPAWKFGPTLLYMSGLEADSVNTTVSLDPILDLGFDVDYQINPKWGAFLTMRNLIGRDNERYHYYNTRTYDIKAGVRYRF